MLTREQAAEAVTQALDRRIGSVPVALVDEETIERPLCWVFFYNSKQFLETGIFEHRLAGNGPVIVNKKTGDVEFFGTFRSPLFFVEEYEKKWAARNAHTP